MNNFLRIFIILLIAVGLSYGGAIFLQIAGSVASIHLLAAASCFCLAITGILIDRISSYVTSYRLQRDALTLDSRATWKAMAVDLQCATCYKDNKVLFNMTTNSFICQHCETENAIALKFASAEINPLDETNFNNKYL